MFWKCGGLMWIHVMLLQKKLQVTLFCKWNRFGEGYTITLRLAESESTPDMCAVNSYMKNCFPMIDLKECHQTVLTYQLPEHACNLAQIFTVLANHEALGISAFSVSQTNMDQVRTRLKQTEHLVLRRHMCIHVLQVENSKPSIHPLSDLLILKRVAGVLEPANRRDIKQLNSIKQIKNHF